MSVEAYVGVNVPGQIQEQLREAEEKAKIEEAAKAKYKIEVHFGPDRSRDPLKPSAGAILMWESGKKFHGGGDEQMFWCGYEDCGWPFSSENLALMHAICPKCHRELFTDHLTRQQHIDHLKEEGRSSRGIENIPCMSSEKLWRLPPTKLAELLVKTFRQLGSNADIYLKYHPEDIRIDKKDPGSRESMDKLRLARLRKKPMIYPLKNILKDTAAGADLHKRFLAMLVA